jgi:N-acetylglutamate synthase-like GNAT family acetyltransferase
VIIRPWKVSDCPQIVALVQTILKQEFPQDQKAYPVGDLQNLEKSYGGTGDSFFVAEEEGRVIGTCGVKADGEKTAILRRFFVDAGHRGRGVGRGLLEQTLAFCREKKFREVLIRTSASMEQAIQVCRKAGFEPDGDWSFNDAMLVRYRLKLS